MKNLLKLLPLICFVIAEYIKSLDYSLPIIISRITELSCLRVLHLEQLSTKSVLDIILELYVYTLPFKRIIQTYKKQ